MTEVECTRCGYEWEYGGELASATCPSCRYKTTVDDDDSGAVPAEN